MHHAVNSKQGREESSVALLPSFVCAVGRPGNGRERAVGGTGRTATSEQLAQALRPERWLRRGSPPDARGPP